MSASFLTVLNSSLAPKPIKENLFAAASWVLRVALEMCPVLAFGMAGPRMLVILQMALARFSAPAVG